MTKILVSIVIVLSLLISVLPVYAVDNADLTYLYLDKGNITIGDGTVTGYGYFGEKITTYDEDGYYISQTGTDVVTNTITFDGGKNYVVLNNLKVSLSNQSNWFSCALNITNSADVTISLKGTNVLISGNSRAGVEVAVDSAVTIEGEGRLLAGSNGQAGIGGGNGHSSGSVTINSGTITAQSISNSAGIGGGSAGSNGTVTINGGNVTAIGGESAAGIGGGSTGDGGEVIINGGTVTATGGANAAGIGGGWYGSMGNIIINGGSVKATGGQNAPSIGAGAGVESDAILNSYGEVLYLATVDTASVSSVKEVYTDGKANNISSYHSGDTAFYFYLPAETHIIAADSDESVTGFWMAEYETDFICSSVTPFECVNGSSVRADDVIRGISCGLSDLNDYFTLFSGFSFEYSDSVIGTGTKVNLIFNNQTVFTYTALLYGDLDKDGYYDGEDSFIALLMLWGNLNSSNTDAVYLEAADVNRNGEIDQSDVDTLQKAGLLLQEVSQNEDGTVNTDSTEWAEYTQLITQSEEEPETVSLLEIITEFLTVIMNALISVIESFTNA